MLMTNLAPATTKRLEGLISATFGGAPEDPREGRVTVMAFPDANRSTIEAIVAEDPNYIGIAPGEHLFADFGGITFLLRPVNVHTDLDD